MVTEAHSDSVRRVGGLPRDRRYVFVSADTIWHRKLAEALAGQGETVALTMATGWPAPLQLPAAEPGVLQCVPCRLPPGWASKTAQVGQRLLAVQVKRIARHMGGRAGVILTGPHLTVLARQIKPRLPYAYYCADDYRSYVGWGGAARVAAAERQLVSGATVSIFVSEALRDRAVKEYGLDVGRTLVSPNATEERFDCEHPDPHDTLPFPPLKRPVVGILGGLSARLDLELVRHIAELPDVGTLLVVGPIEESVRAREPWVVRPGGKIHVTGPVDHSLIHVYAKRIDLALIPYGHSALNWFCSPMRLYDHLATGVEIFATDACDQVNRMRSSPITVGPAPAVISGILEAIGSRRWTAERHSRAKGHRWLDRAEAIARLFPS